MSPFMLKIFLPLYETQQEITEKIMNGWLVTSVDEAHYTWVGG
jgi:hypothetical protein